LLGRLKAERARDVAALSAALSEEFVRLRLEINKLKSERDRLRRICDIQQALAIERGDGLWLN
jgi:hypothetical protein